MLFPPVPDAWQRFVSWTIWGHALHAPGSSTLSLLSLPIPGAKQPILPEKTPPIGFSPPLNAELDVPAVVQDLGCPQLLSMNLCPPKDLGLAPWVFPFGSLTTGCHCNSSNSCKSRHEVTSPGGLGRVKLGNGFSVSAARGGQMFCPAVFGEQLELQRTFLCPHCFPCIRQEGRKAGAAVPSPSSGILLELRFWDSWGGAGTPWAPAEPQLMAISLFCSLEDRMSQLNHDRGGQEAELQIQEKFQSGNCNPGASTFGEMRSAWPSWEGSRAGESSSLCCCPSPAQLPWPAQGGPWGSSSLTPAFPLSQQISVSQIKVDKVQIIGVQSSFAVCLDQDEQKILQSVTRWELQALDGWCCSRSQAEPAESPELSVLGLESS